MRALTKFRILILVWLIWPALCMALVHINGLDVSAKPHHWRLVFLSDGPLEFNAFQLQKPNRLVLDIEHAKLSHQFSRPKLVATPVNRIRSANRKNQQLRLVLDLAYPVKIKAFTLKPHLNRGYRLVVDLLGHQQKVLAFSWPKKSKKNANINYKGLPKLVNIKPVLSSKAPKSKRNIVVVIDPGHGGKDPGATGRRGTHEKNIVLHIARYLQAILNKQPGFHAVLTRRGDYYIPLRGRLAIARRYKADMFISIHADAYQNRNAYGASVFALSRRGATSEAARWLAARENQSELMGGVELADKGSLLKSVLINLSQTATIRASLHIGQALLHSLGSISRLHHSTVEQAAFVVLKSPDIPSLLVESGFVSNSREELRLRSARYQHRLAKALMRGITRYFTKRPPRGTFLSYWRDHPNRRPKRG